MRWNCPHCGTALSVADDKLSNTWSFSKCFQCSGYALVRKSDLNLIKVDDAPKGEKIVRPSADISAISEARITRPEQITAIIEKKPESKATIANVIAQAQAAAPTPTEAPVTVEIPLPHKNSEFTNIVLEPVVAASVPSFVPPSRPTTLAPPAAPVAQTQARQEPSFSNELKWILPDSPEQASAAPTFSGSDEIQTSFTRRKPILNRTKLIPLSVGFAAAIAIGSGLMMVQESSKITKRRARSQTTTAQMMSTIQIPAAMKAAPQAQPLSDTVKEKAMAPTRAVEPPVSTSSIEETQAQNDLDTPVKPHRLKMGSTQEAIAALVVQIRVPQATLRSGPGLSFPVTGKARLSSNFVVKDWRGEWFRIVLPEENQGLRDLLKGEPRTAWIRNDLVRLVTLDP